jgi:hypothetical protein
MKTSNKLLLAAVLLLSAYCVASAFALKAEYLKGDYKSRFYRMKQLNFAGFDAVEADIPNTAITIEQGAKFAVWITNDLPDIETGQKNKTLTINNKPGTKPSYGYGSSVIIICPQLVSLKLGKQLSKQEKLAIATQIDPYIRKIDGSYNTISGFKQKSMTVEINNATTLQLQQTNIDKLNAFANRGNLSVEGPNIIDTANFDIGAYNSLEINYADIKNPTYKLANTAKITVSGQSLHLLRKQ